MISRRRQQRDVQVAYLTAAAPAGLAGGVAKLALVARGQARAEINEPLASNALRLRVVCGRSWLAALAVGCC